jgi:hypothetical protein
MAFPSKPCEFVDVLVPLRNQKGSASFARMRRTSVLPRMSYTEGGQRWRLHADRFRTSSRSQRFEELVTGMR